MKRSCRHFGATSGYYTTAYASGTPIALACYNSKEYTYDAHMQHCWWIYPHQTGSVGFFVASIRA